MYSERDGFVIGGMAQDSGAGRPEVCAATRRTDMSEIMGYGMRPTLTTLPASGRRARVMAGDDQRNQNAKLNPADIDYVNAHGHLYPDWRPAGNQGHQTDLGAIQKLPVSSTNQ